eukprot:CAMPEP_0172541568 /NCGR_PEP_ID=MMETSP1067-20121228/12354_1 /TAXON_ID=265564 ORGANISM="Thalassiosira punctigera, Strain Tpunct2005C2" /NCGR_SAMPLE_ID=MMETSP1067 /ASSEMBLY_ACC=CAM_ASM_000444 /LENGTH=145 /DNA_ID=CAMNT_0013327633 /DNA_START=60 /DNA_END=497 /DNA_ORIENTATION=-
MNIDAMQEHQGLQRCQTPPSERVIHQLSPPPPPAPIMGGKRLFVGGHGEKAPSFLPRPRSMISDNPRPSPNFVVVAMVENCHLSNLPRHNAKIHLPTSKFLKRRPVFTDKRGERTRDAKRLAEDMPPLPFSRRAKMERSIGQPSE